jgi:hypothetical protein
MILSSNKKTIIFDNNSNIYELEQFQYSIDEEILKGKKVNFTDNENKDKINEYQKAYQKDYRDNNKEKRTEKFVCPCGSISNYSNKSKHLKHFQNIKTI